MRAVIFLVLLVACIIGCTFIWDSSVDGKIYNCTDSIPFGFLHPGDWVHAHDGLPVAIVPKINPTDPMNKPDTIKEGWSIPKLWVLWGAFVFTSVAISAPLAFLSFRCRKLEVAQKTSP